MTDLSKNIQALREKKAVVEMGGGEAAIEKRPDGHFVAILRNDVGNQTDCP